MKTSNVIFKMLDLSTGHLTALTRALLEANALNGALYYAKGPWGWFLNVPTIEDGVEIDPSLPVDLKQCLHYAQGQKVEWIVFDCDGSYVAELATYEDVIRPGAAPGKVLLAKGGNLEGQTTVCCVAAENLRSRSVDWWTKLEYAYNQYHDFISDKSMDADTVTLFDLQVPKDSDPGEIADLVDQAMQGVTYNTDLRRVGKDGVLDNHPSLFPNGRDLSGWSFRHAVEELLRDRPKAVKCKAASVPKRRGKDVESQG